MRPNLLTSHPRKALAEVHGNRTHEPRSAAGTPDVKGKDPGEKAPQKRMVKAFNLQRGARLCAPFHHTDSPFMRCKKTLRRFNGAIHRHGFIFLRTPQGPPRMAPKLLVGGGPQRRFSLMGIRDHAVIHVSTLIAGLVIVAAVIIVGLTRH